MKTIALCFVMLLVSLASANAQEVPVAEQQTTVPTIEFSGVLRASVFEYKVNMFTFQINTEVYIEVRGRGALVRIACGEEFEHQCLHTAEGTEIIVTAQILGPSAGFPDRKTEFKLTELVIAP